MAEKSLETRPVPGSGKGVAARRDVSLSVCLILSFMLINS